MLSQKWPPVCVGRLYSWRGTLMEWAQISFRSSYRGFEVLAGAERLYQFSGSAPVLDPGHVEQRVVAVAVRNEDVTSMGGRAVPVSRNEDSRTLSA